MQVPDFSHNPSNWKVVQDPATTLFYCKNDNGNRLTSMYTTKRFAEQALDQYLRKLIQRRHKWAKDKMEKEETIERTET
jgi:hypothetical protein